MGTHGSTSNRPSLLLGAACTAVLTLGTGRTEAAVTLSADAAMALESKVLLSGLTVPTDVAVLPDGRVIIVQKSGDIATVPAGGGDPIEDHIDVNTTSEQGLLGVVADPNFATNQFIYVYADRPDPGAGATTEQKTMARNNRHQVFRYKFGADSKLGTKTVVIDMGLEGPANHDGGGLDIYQGNLYIGVGDTGANASPPTNRYGSCLNHGNGKVLRVSLAEATLGQPATDNPLVSMDMVTGCDSTGGAFKMVAPDKRIYAWGFRNPYRVWVDKTNGQVWVGDVGETTREEIDVVQKGKHHGYPFWEGAKDWMTESSFNTPGGCMDIMPASQCVAPVYDYDRTGMDASVIGGRILDGCNWPDPWKNRYVFGDYNLGKVWTLDVNATRDGVMANSRKDFATSNKLTGIRMGTDNALYLLEEGGNVTRITVKGDSAKPGSCPAINGETPNSGGGTGGTGAGGGNAGGSSGANPGSAGKDGDTAGAPTGDAGQSSQGGSPGSGGPSGGSSPAEAGKNGATAGSSSGGSSSSSGGCGCTVAGAPANLAAGGALSILALGLGLRRRRGSRSP